MAAGNGGSWKQRAKTAPAPRKDDALGRSMDSQRSEDSLQRLSDSLRRGSRRHSSANPNFDQVSGGGTSWMASPGSSRGARQRAPVTPHGFSPHSSGGFGRTSPSRGGTSSRQGLDSSKRRSLWSGGSLQDSAGCDEPSGKQSSKLSSDGALPQNSAISLFSASGGKGEVSKFVSLLKKFLSEMSALKALGKSVIEEVMHAVGFASRAQGYVLFEEGEEPDACYIILQGKVQFWRQGQEIDVPFPSEDCTPSARKTGATVAAMLSKVVASGSPTASPPAPGLEGSRGRRGSLDRVHHYGSIVASYGPATLVGDSELLVDQLRLATAVVCSESCELLIIEGPDFDRLLRAALLHAEVQRVGGPIKEMLMEFDFFRRLDAGVKASVTEVMSFDHCRKGDVLFRQNDPPGLCYIILSGGVGVFVDGLESGPQCSRKTAGQAVRGTCHAILGALRRLHTLMRLALEAEGPPDDGLAELEARARQVAWLGPGMIFGELALLEDQPRSASVVCLEDSTFLPIEGADFERVLKRAMKNAVMSLPILAEPLLKELPFFHALSPTVLQRVRHILSYAAMKSGQVICWEDSPPEHCFILLSGQVSCWQHRGDDAGLSSYARRANEVYSDGVYEKCADLASRLEEVDRSASKEPAGSKRVSDSVFERFGTRRPMQRRDSMEEVMGHRVATLKAGAVLNEHAMLVNEPCEATVVCDRDCQLLAIERAQFDRVVKEEVIRSKVQELQSQVRRLFRGLPMFEDLGPAVQEQVPDIARYAFEPDGTVLFREGEVAELCYIILSGEVTIWKAVAASDPDSGQDTLPDINVADGGKAADGGAPSSAGREDAKSTTSGAGREDGLLPPVNRGQSKVGPGPRLGEEERREEERPKLLSLSSQSFGSRRSAEPRARPFKPKPSPEAYERCTQLAARLEPVSRCLERKEAPPETEDEYAERTGDTAVACLGPGSMFGEWALLNNDPRSASVTCHGDCEFLVIEKCDFDRVVKQEMARAKAEKLAFLQTYVPGIRQIGDRRAGQTLNHFVKKTVPMNHVFMEQGQVGDGCMYFVWRGSVEFHTHTFPEGADGKPLLPGNGFRRLRVLIKGGVFGAVPFKSRLAFTAVARSSPCEVLVVTMEQLKDFPRAVVDGLRQLLDHTSVWTSAGANHFPSEKAGLDHPLPSLSSIPRSQSSRVPRPLSGKIPKALDGRSPGLGSIGLPVHARSSALSVRRDFGGGLFQRERSEKESMRYFAVQPGEVLALRARGPKRRDAEEERAPRVRAAASGVAKSVSLPSMQASRR